MLACISLAWGNLAALAQRDVKRLLAYSSISHAGFMLIAVAAGTERGAESLLYYLVPYSAMSVGAFAVVAARERELGVPVKLESLAGLGWERPFYGVALWIFMLGMAGFPLTGGFFGKLFVFSAAYEAGDWWLVLVGVAATVLSLAYYLNVVRWLYMRAGHGAPARAGGGSPPREYALGLGGRAAASSSPSARSSPRSRSSTSRPRPRARCRSEQRARHERALPSATEHADGDERDRGDETAPAASQKTPVASDARSPRARGRRGTDRRATRVAAISPQRLAATATPQPRAAAGGPARSIPATSSRTTAARLL